MTSDMNFKKVSGLWSRHFLLDLKPLSKISSIFEPLIIKENNIMYHIYPTVIPQWIF